MVKLATRNNKKPIICSRCGKKVGWVTLKWRFRVKLILWGFLIALFTQMLTQIPAEILASKILGQ